MPRRAAQQPKRRSDFPNRFIQPAATAATAVSSLDTVDPSSISPADFHRRYITSRTPCLLSPPPSSAPWRTDRWSNAYLRVHAGECLVQVEKRTSAVDGFGQGSKRSLPLAAFIDAIDTGDSSMYLTTQYTDEQAEEEEDGKHGKKRRRIPEVSTDSPSSSSASSSCSSSSDLRYLLAPPLTHLLPDFPLLPPLFSHLIPHQYNLWFGHSPSTPTSSRLHHDYHDNLYLLLRGTKTFTLISPVYAGQLGLVGRVREVKRNGLVCYDEGVHEDGSAEAERLEERKRMVEDEVARVEGEVERLEREEGKDTEGVKDMRQRLSELEDELDGLLEATLDLEGGDGMDEEQAEGEEEDDKEDDGVDPAELDAWKQWQLQSQRKRRLPAAHASKRPPPARRASDTIGPSSPPPNFSTLSTATLPASIPRLTVRLRAPAMLYLPASWMHEVFSETDELAADKGHLALNFWFIPPDRLEGEAGEDAGEDAFARSYTEHRLWAHRWERQREQLERMAAEVERRRALRVHVGQGQDEGKEQQRPVGDARQMKQAAAASSSTCLSAGSHDDAAPAKGRSGGVFGQRGWLSQRGARTSSR